MRHVYVHGALGHAEDAAGLPRGLSLGDPEHGLGLAEVRHSERNGLPLHVRPRCGPVLAAGNLAQHPQLVARLELQARCKPAHAGGLQRFYLALVHAQPGARGQPSFLGV